MITQNSLLSLKEHKRAEFPLWVSHCKILFLFPLLCFSPRLSLLWWNWWRSVGTRTLLPGWPHCASRRPWTRSTALWRRARSHERERSPGGSCLALRGARCSSKENGLKVWRTENQKKDSFKCHPASSFSLLSDFHCGCLPLTSLSLTWSPHRHLELSCLNKPAFATGRKPVANVSTLTWTVDCYWVWRTMDGIL